jgi:TRAP-type uncharacterized transport system substrate-binding protein
MKYLNTFFARTTIAVALAAAVFAPTAQAAEDASPGANALRIGSGPDGKLYQLLVRDMQAVCGNDVPIVNVQTVGGIPNLMGLSASELDLGIVQLDTLQAIGKDGDENIQSLQAVMPLHINLLHVLALREGYKPADSERSVFSPWKKDDAEDSKVVRKFTDLKNLKVAAVGSTMLLGQKLSEQNDLNINLRKAESDDEAVKLLRDNKVQAIFTDGGWPLPSIARHKSDSGLTLVEYNIAARAPFVVVKRNYQNLDAFNFKFLGSPNLLVTRPFKPNGEMGKKVSALQNCLLKHMDELQEGHFQAAWKEIKSPNDTLGVTRFTKAK